MKKIFSLLCAVLLLVGITQAAEVSVAAQDNLATACANAQDGDVLLLAPGTYSAGLKLPAGKSITIKSAKPDSMAVLTGVVNGTADINYTVEGKNGSLVFDNVKIDRNSQNFIDTREANQKGTIDLIAFRNCEITNIRRCLMLSNADINFPIGKIEVSGCIVHDCHTESWNHFYIGNPVSEVVFENNTYYNNFLKDASGNPALSPDHTDGRQAGTMESFFFARADVSTYTMNFVFKNNTVYQGGRKGGTYPVCQIGNNYNLEYSTYLFENNIFIAPEPEFPGFMLLRAEGALDVVIKKNLIHNYPDTVAIPEGMVFNELGAANITDNYTLEDLGYASPTEVFSNPKGGDFALYKGSPIATAASDEGVLGAKGWLREPTELVTLTRGYYEGSDNTMGAIAGPEGKIALGTEVTLTTTKNFGYKFVKWVDEAGVTLSEDVSYKFTMDADKTVLAVFDKINVYTLTINIAGTGGLVTYDDTGSGDRKIYTVPLQYEEGASLDIQAQGSPIAEFVIWNDGDNEPSRVITMEEDIELTATFTTKSFIVGWDFSTLTATNAVHSADYLGEGVNPYTTPALKLYLSNDGTVTEQSLGGHHRLVNDRKARQHWGRRPTDGLAGNDVDGPFADCTKEFFYWQTEVSTKGFGDVTVYYSLNAANYKTHTKYFFQYSADNGLSWETAGTFDTPANTWVDRDTTIAYTGGLDKLILRWMPDTSSPTVRKVTGGGGCPDCDGFGYGRDVESLAIVDFYILAEGKGPWDSLDTQSVDAVNAWVDNGTLTINGVTNSSEAYLFGIDGRLVAQFTANEGTTIKNFSSLKGIYILRVNGVTTKLIF